MQISVMLSNLKLPFEEALDAVQSLDIPAVQLSISPDDDAAKRKQMLDSVQRRGLNVSAICVDLYDLGESEKAEESLDTVKPLLEIAAEMANGICQTHVGVMPHTMKGARWDSFVRRAAAIAHEGEKIGACLAVETGPEPPRVLERLLQTVDSPGLKINYDPANFIIWPAVFPKFPDIAAQTEVEQPAYDRERAFAEFEPVEGVKRLGPYIVHTHAKDGIGDGGWGDVPLGTGWVDWPRYLWLLKDAGYDGYLAIEREAGDDPVGEIGHAARFLREQLSALEK